MQNSLEQMETSRTEDSNILALMAKHFNRDAGGKNEEKKNTPRAAEFKAPDPTTIPATSSAKGTSAQSQRNTDGQSWKRRFETFYRTRMMWMT